MLWGWVTAGVTAPSEDKHIPALWGNIISTAGNVISVDIESGQNVTARVRNTITIHHQHYLFKSVWSFELKRWPLESHHCCRIRLYCGGVTERRGQRLQEEEEEEWFLILALVQAAVSSSAELRERFTAARALTPRSLTVPGFFWVNGSNRAGGQCSTWSYIHQWGREWKLSQDLNCIYFFFCFQKRWDVTYLDYF